MELLIRDYLCRYISGVCMIIAVFMIYYDVLKMLTNKEKDNA